MAVLIGVIVSIASNHQSYTSLQAGDCFDPAGHGIFSVLVTKKACDKPHLDEAVGSFDLDGRNLAGRERHPDRGRRPDAWPWPGSTVGQTTTRLQLVWLYPKQASFDNGVRNGACARSPPATGASSRARVAAGSPSTPLRAERIRLGMAGEGEGKQAIQMLTDRVLVQIPRSEGERKSRPASSSRRPPRSPGG